MSDRVDTLIVGGGTAGCVLAARLADDPARRVTLLEAGPDQPGDRRRGVEEISVPGGATPYARGKVLGGCSTVNDGGLWRAPSADFVAWSGLGLPSWSWDVVLPAYRRLERDPEFGEEPWHGSSGPTPIARPMALQPPAAALRAALTGVGEEWVADMNAPTAAGFGRYPKDIRDGRVISTAQSHLAPARSRLRVRTDAPVDRLVLRHGRVVGVETRGEEIDAGEVILCAGAVGTPALLLRSGIGARDVLDAAGVDIAVELLGAGKGICDQPGAVLPAMPKPGVVPEDAERSQLVARLVLDSTYDEPPALYMCLFVGPPPGGDTTMLALMVGDLAPQSRGSVWIDRRGDPQVDLALLAEKGDVVRMRTAYRRAWEVLRHKTFADVVDQIMVNAATIDDDNALDELLRGQVFSRLATLGCARMGIDPDQGAVVDDRLRVYGVPGLCVADLSIVPVPLHAPSAAEAMMIGEHAAEILR